MTRHFMKPVAVLVFSLCFLTGAMVGFSQEPEKAATSPQTEKTTPSVKRDSPLQTIFNRSSANVEAVADSLEYQKGTNKLIARGNVVLTYQNMKILADYAELETATKKSYARGHVLIFENDEPIMTGDEAYYDFENQTGSFPDGRAYNKPFYATGQEIDQIREGVIKVKDGTVTTCDLEKPHYEIRAKKATLHDGVKITMWNVTIYVLGKPVFWLPYLSIPLNWNIPFQAAAGYKSEYGAYLELSKGITFNEHLSGKLHVDWRAKRGFGGGWDQDYDFGKYAKGDIKLYWTQDKRAPTPGYQASSEDAEETGGIDPYAKREERDRGRITWRHRTDINDYTNIIMRYHRVADEYFLQDFFEEEYRAEMEPHSFVTATHNSQRYGAMVHLEKRMNSYESIVERMPEVRLDWKNQPFFFTDKVYNVSRLQFDNLSKKFSRDGHYGNVFRADGYTRFIVPAKFKEIKMTSMLGYRGTEYSRDALDSNAHYRQMIEYSVDVRTQAYKVMDITFDKAGIEINQLRHIFEPSVTYKGQESSLTSVHKMTHFDTIDMIDSSSEVVFGIENRLQTKRVLRGKSQRVDLVSLNTYVHYSFKNPDPTLSGGGGFTTLTNEVTLRPYEWLQFQHRLDVDLARKYVKTANHDLVIRRGKFRLLFGHRYIHDQYDYMSSLRISRANQFVVEGQYKLNHLWTFGGYMRWDTSDGDLEEWQVAATRDLHDFILDFGFNQRKSLINDHDKQLYFRFRMKAFPSLALRGGGGGAEFSAPRIGETVAGANEDRGHYSISKDSQFWGM